MTDRELTEFLDGLSPAEMRIMLGLMSGQEALSFDQAVSCVKRVRERGTTTRESPCPPWCRRKHAVPGGSHLKNLATLESNGLTVEVNLIGGAQSAFVRIFVTDTDATSSFVDIQPEVAEALGLIISMFDDREIRNLGFAFTASAGYLLGGGR